MPTASRKPRHCDPHNPRDIQCLAATEDRRNPPRRIFSSMPPTQPEARIALTTLPNREEAERLARRLVDVRHAACVSLIERVHSIYRWQGAVEEAGEVMLIIKTDAAHLALVEETVHAVHSYENPEFLVLVPESGSASYLHWISASLAP